MCGLVTVASFGGFSCLLFVHLFLRRNILQVNILNYISQVALFLACWYICTVYFDPSRVSVTLKRDRFVTKEGL